MIGIDAEGLVNIIIEDYELYDYIEDYINENCDVEYEYRSEVENSKGSAFVMHFSSKYGISEIEAYLLKLEPEYLEEIYSINN